MRTHRDIAESIADHILDLIERERRFRDPPRDPGEITLDVAQQARRLCQDWGYSADEAHAIAERARNLVRNTMIARQLPTLVMRSEKPVVVQVGPIGDVVDDGDLRRAPPDDPTTDVLGTSALEEGHGNACMRATRAIAKASN